MTTPVYNKGIPLPDNTIAQGQPDLLNNFSTLSNAFSQDHVPLNAASNKGNHNVITLVEQPTTLAASTNEIAIYSKLVPNQTNQLFFKQPGNGAEIQLSNYQIFPLNPIKANGGIVQIPFFSFLPGGIIVYFGQVFPTPPSISFTLDLTPVICKNIIGINYGVMNTGGLPPSNSAVIFNEDGKVSSIILVPSSHPSPGNQIQSYLIFGVT